MGGERLGLALATESKMEQIAECHSRRLMFLLALRASPQSPLYCDSASSARACNAFKLNTSRARAHSG